MAIPSESQRLALLGGTQPKDALIRQVVMGLSGYAGISKISRSHHAFDDVHRSFDDGSGICRCNVLGDRSRLARVLGLLSAWSF